MVAGRSTGVLGRKSFDSLRQRLQWTQLWRRVLVGCIVIGLAVAGGGCGVADAQAVDVAQAEQDAAADGGACANRPDGGPWAWTNLCPDVPVGRCCDKGLKCSFGSCQYGGVRNTMECAPANDGSLWWYQIAWCDP